MTRAPWEYLFESFNRRNFPDLFNATWIAALGLLIVLIVLYIIADPGPPQAPALHGDCGSGSGGRG